MDFLTYATEHCSVNETSVKVHPSPRGYKVAEVSIWFVWSLLRTVQYLRNQPFPLIQSIRYNCQSQLSFIMIIKRKMISYSNPLNLRTRMLQQTRLDSFNHGRCRLKMLIVRNPAHGINPDEILHLN